MQPVGPGQESTGTLSTKGWSGTRASVFQMGIETVGPRVLCGYEAFAGDSGRSQVGRIVVRGVTPMEGLIHKASYSCQAERK